MMDLRELYQEVVVDHNRNPRNFGPLEDMDHQAEGYNPVCGDQLKLFLKISDGRIEKVRFHGEGCAISIASASLMTEALHGKTETEARKLFERFQNMILQAPPQDLRPLGKLAALAGVREFPTRVKCATLSWHTLQAALAGKNAASTE